MICLPWPKQCLYCLYLYIFIIHTVCDWYQLNISKSRVKIESHIFPTSALFQDFATRAKVMVQKLIQRVGFFGILACASVSQITLKPFYYYYSNILHPHYGVYYFKSFCLIHIDAILTFMHHSKEMEVEIFHI